MSAELINCPRCKEPLVFPRGLPAYCEECGWPDEDFDQPEASKEPPRPVTNKKLAQIASATNRDELRQALKGISRKELAKAGIV